MSVEWPDNTYEFAAHFSQVGSLRPAVCTSGFNYTGSAFEVDANHLCLDFVTTIMQAITDHWTLENITFNVLEGQVLDLAQDVGGALAHSSATPNVAYLIKKVTSEPGRRKRGRLFLPGVGEIDVEATGVLAGGQQALLQAKCDSFLAAAAGHKFFPCIIHKIRPPKPGKPTPAVLPPTSVDSWRVDPLAATQRRRMRK